MSIMDFFGCVKKSRKLFSASVIVLLSGFFVFNMVFWAQGSTLSGQPVAQYQEVAAFETAAADLTKVLVTPADEPTPDLTFTFLVERISFNGNPALYNQLPQIGTVVDGIGTIELNINATNGSPSTSGGYTTLTRAIDILEGMNFDIPFPVGEYVWHVAEQENSSGINALAGRSSVEYSDAVYELRVTVSGTTAATRVVAVSFVAVVEDQSASVGTPMYTWGNNNSGQLGHGDTANRNRPQRVTFDDRDNWVSVASAAGGSIAVNADGHLYVWGGPRNSIIMGRGGVGGTADITVPERLSIPAAASDYWIAVDTAGSGQNGVMFAVNDAGELWSWGGNRAGQLGLGDTVARSIPTRVPGSQVWKHITFVNISGTGVGDTAAVLRSFAMAITEDGYLYSWGTNDWGQLGRGTAGTVRLTSPGRVNNPAGTPAGTTFTWKTARAAGGGAAFAIGTDGQLYSWGNNNTDWGDTSVGQLGRPGANTTIPTLTVANAPDSPATHVAPVTGWVDIIQQVNNPRTTIALTNDGRLFSWGAGTAATVAGLGRPGGGAASATRTNRPVQIGTASNWVAIGGGNAHSLAMTNDGRLYSWGANAAGQLGLGNFGTPPALTAGPSFVMQTFGLRGFSQTGSGTHSLALIRTDPMVFTNVYSVTHPSYIALQADIVKHLHELTRTPAQTTSALSFDFEIERYSFNGLATDAALANLPALGITPVTDGVYTLSLAMNVDTSVVHALGRTTHSRVFNVLASAEFDGPGVFVWRINEVTDSSGATAPSQVSYSPAIYYLTVTITEAAGELTGAVAISVDTPDSDILIDSDSMIMPFTNTHLRTSNLLVSKAVTGSIPPTGQEFPFTVVLTRSAICNADTTFTARVYTADSGGGPSTFERLEVFEHNIARNINLQGGQYFVFEAIAESAGFNVTEVVPADFSGSLELTVGGAMVLPPMPPVNVDDVGRNLSTGDRLIGIGTNSAAFTNAHHFAPPAGLNVVGNVPAVVAVFPAIALAAYFARQHRKRIEQLPPIAD